MAGEVIKVQEALPAPRRSFDEVMHMAESFARSNLFGAKTVDQALALMMMAEAEGKHVATAMQDYDIIQGRPALKADAMLGRFQLAGGHVKWLKMTDDECAAEFSHPTCAPHVIDWDMERAKAAGLGSKDNWRKFKRQMLRARVIAEGVRSTFPACLRGAPHYVSEEVQDFEPTPQHSPRAVAAPTPASPAVEVERTEAGGANANDAPPVSFHDQPSNVPGGFKSLKQIEVDEEQRTDHTQDPEWTSLSNELSGNCECRADVLAWWDSHKKKLKARKPHFAKAFHQQVIIPFAASFAQTVEWDDEAGARG